MKKLRDFCFEWLWWCWKSDEVDVMEMRMKVKEFNDWVEGNGSEPDKIVWFYFECSFETRLELQLVVGKLYDESL